MTYAGTPTASFGSHRLGSSTMKTYTVSNGGVQPLNISAINFPANFIQAASGGTDCNASMELAPDVSCQLAIEFFPTSGSTAGTPVSGNVTINSNSANAVSGVNSIAVSGTAVSKHRHHAAEHHFQSRSASTATYGQKIAVNATASSGLRSTMLVSGPATLIGNTLTVTGVGTITVTAYQFGDSGDATTPTDGRRRHR